MDIIENHFFDGPNILESVFCQSNSNEKKNNKGTIIFEINNEKTKKCYSLKAKKSELTSGQAFLWLTYIQIYNIKRALPLNFKLAFN